MRIQKEYVRPQIKVSDTSLQDDLMIVIGQGSTTEQLSTDIPVDVYQPVDDDTPQTVWDD